MALNAQYPHVLQKAMSHEKTPVLAGTFPAVQSLMSKWERMVSKEPDYAPWIKPGLDCVLKCYMHRNDTRAHIIALCKC